MGYARMTMLLDMAWKIARARTKGNKGTLCLSIGATPIPDKKCKAEDRAFREHEIADPVRIGLGGFIASFAQVNVPDELRPDWKFGPDQLMMRKLGGSSMAGRLVGHEGELEAEKAKNRTNAWFEQVFELGVKMMDAQGSKQNNKWSGLDRHAFVYCWLVAYGMQYVSCIGHMWMGCSMTPENDEFFGPPDAKYSDNVGPLAKVRSKLWQSRVVAGLKDPEKELKKDPGSQFDWLQDATAKKEDENIDKGRFIKYWHTVNAESMDKDQLEPFHAFMKQSFEAAKNHGWQTAQRLDRMPGSSFQYMSLLAGEFPIKRQAKGVVIGTKKWIKHPDRLKLFKRAVDAPELYPIEESEESGDDTS